VIKIDVEGFESEVVGGARQLIFGGQNHPDIIVELLTEEAQQKFFKDLPDKYEMYAITETTGEIVAPPEGSRFHWNGPVNYWATCRGKAEINAIVVHLQKLNFDWRISG